jgi:hypothetical protein
MKCDCETKTQARRKAAIFSVMVILINLMFLISPPLTAMGIRIERDEKTRKRQEDLDFLYNTLKEVHPDLFSNAEEALFLAKKEEISRRIGVVDDFIFALELQSFVALVGDSHTTVSLNSDGLHLYPFSLDYYNGHPVLAMAHKDSKELLGQRIIAINDFPMEKVLERFRDIISHDNEVQLRLRFKQLVNCTEVLEYCGFSEPGGRLSLTVSDAHGRESKIDLGTPVEAAMVQTIVNDLIFLDNLRTGYSATEFNRGKIYYAKALSDSVYYIQYNQCREDINFPMVDFCAQITDDLKATDYNKIILDMRYNGGGSDGVLVPLLTLLSEVQRTGNVKLFCLVDERTFSSAIINAMMMKEMGAIVVGAPTGGSVNHFGSIERFTLPNSGINVTYSTKLINIADYLESGHGYGIETLVPDYEAGQTLDDYLNGIDTTVQFVMEHGDNLELQDNMDVMLTRGSFAALLYQKAKDYGKGVERGYTGIFDVFPFARNTPAIEWAYHAGIITVISDGRLAPSNLITREEIAVMLARFADYLDFTLNKTSQIYIEEVGEGFEPDEHMSCEKGMELINNLFP